jgi:GLPGLI family protein
MKKKLILLACLLTGFSTTLSAQNARFATEGVIEYNRSTNMYAVLQKQVNSSNSSFLGQIVDDYKRKSPQFKVLKSTLSFSKNKTLFTPIEDTAAPIQWFGDSPEISQINTIYTDLTTKEKFTRKKVYEETFVVKDTARVINWKITGETREIAGYECRRANAVIMDSVYVVAFYTDEIPVSGGPESFNGLPGMILGLALPHDNVTWFATIVNDRPVDAKVLVPPTKGKATDVKGLIATLSSALKEYGTYYKTMLKAFLL